MERQLIQQAGHSFAAVSLMQSGDTATHSDSGAEFAAALLCLFPDGAVTPVASDISEGGDVPQEGIDARSEVEPEMIPVGSEVRQNLQDHRTLSADGVVVSGAMLRHERPHAAAVRNDAGRPAAAPGSEGPMTSTTKAAETDELAVGTQKIPASRKSEVSPLEGRQGSVGEILEKLTSSRILDLGVTPVRQADVTPDDAAEAIGGGVSLKGEQAENSKDVTWPASEVRLNSRQLIEHSPDRRIGQNVNARILAERGPSAAESSAGGIAEPRSSPETNRVWGPDRPLALGRTERESPRPVLVSANTELVGKHQLTEQTIDRTNEPITGTTTRSERPTMAPQTPESLAFARGSTSSVEHELMFSATLPPISPEQNVRTVETNIPAVAVDRPTAEMRRPQPVQSGIHRLPQQEQMPIPARQIALAGQEPSPASEEGRTDLRSGPPARASGLVPQGNAHSQIPVEIEVTRVRAESDSQGLMLIPMPLGAAPVDLSIADSSAAEGRVLVGKVARAGQMLQESTSGQGSVPEPMKETSESFRAEGAIGEKGQSFQSAGGIAGRPEIQPLDLDQAHGFHHRTPAHGAAINIPFGYAQSLSIANYTPITAVQQMVQVSGNLAHGPVEIALAPEELGRVRMMLAPSEHGMVLSITADRGDTLALLRRHVDILTSDLRDLGFEDLTFQFRSGNSGGNQTGGNQSTNVPVPIGQTDDEPGSERSSLHPHIPEERVVEDTRLDLRL